MRIRTYSPDMAGEITELFYKSVNTINPLLYSAKQKAAWVSGNSETSTKLGADFDYDAWAERLIKT